jgi:hypothetical protein
MPVVWLAAITLLGASLVQLVIGLPLGLIDLVGQILPGLGWLLLLGVLAWFLGD